MTAIENPAGAACFIVLIAAICSIFSLLVAVDSKRGQFTEITSRWFWKMIVALSVVSVITMYACVYYLLKFPGIPFPRFMIGNDHWVVRGLALSMLFLLGFVISLTGGATQSWFTPFLLVLVPLLMLLNEPEGLVLWIFLAAVVGVYVATAFWPSPLKLRDEKRYKICCSIFVFLAVFFPTFLQLFSTKNG